MIENKSLPNYDQNLEIDEGVQHIIDDLGKTFASCSIDETPNDNIDLSKIVHRFRSNIKDKQYTPKSFNEIGENKGKKTNHHGSEGYWLEQQIGINQNCFQNADIDGFEIKKFSKKITFGDWKPDEIIFDPKYIINQYNCNIPRLTRDQFLQIFGSSNPQKNGRSSWSGSCIPKIHKFNMFGQTMIIDNKDNIFIVYSYKYDEFRESKPEWTKDKNLIIAYWSAEKLLHCLNRKFNNKGFIMFKKNAENIYKYMLVGRKISFEYWISQVRLGTVFFDSGMYQGNLRYYSHWRAKHKFWDNLIYQEYT